MNIKEFKKILIGLRKENLTKADLVFKIDNILKSKKEILIYYLKFYCGSKQGTIQEIISSEFKNRIKSIKNNHQIKNSKQKKKKIKEIEDNLISEVEEYIIKNKIYMDMKL